MPKSSITQSPASSGSGQPDPTPSPTGTSQADPAAQTDGQAQGGAPGTSQQTPGSSTITVEELYDPKELEARLANVAPEVANQIRALAKQLHGTFTKKTESISKSRQKIEAYDAFMADPVGEIQKLARQYGFQLNQPQSQPSSQGNGNETWEPKTWDDVISKMRETIMGEVQEYLKPVFSNVQKVTASNIERQLDEIDPMWRTYEDDMKENIRTHPTLVNDVAKLYRISVPEDLLKSKAIQSALKQIEEKTKSANIHGSHSTSRSEPAPKKATSFNEAVAIAREQCRKEGTYKG